MKKTLLERLSDDLLVMTINRPEVRNAIDYDVMEEFNLAINTVKEDLTIKAFIITGAGKDAFCSGGDLSVFHGLHSQQEAYFMLAKMGNILYDLMTLDRPTIALMNGVAVGGGCEIATACDFRVSSHSSKFGFIQGKLGITTGWGGGTIILEKLPYETANQLLYSAKVHTSEKGKELGFINEVFKDDSFKEEGILWTKDLIQNCSSSVIAAYKQMNIRKWYASNLKERMDEEIKQCSILWESEEHHQAVNSFLSRKKN